jgi:hypothetical protein
VTTSATARDAISGAALNLPPVAAAGARRVRGDAVADAEAITVTVVLERDRARPHIDQVPHLAHPRQDCDSLPAELAEENVPERRALILVSAFVDVQTNRPR